MGDPGQSAGGAGGGGGDPMAQLMNAMYGGMGPAPGGYMGNPNIGMPQSWMMPVAGSNAGIPVMQGPSWVGPAFNPDLGY